MPYLDEFENLNFKTTPPVAELEIGEADTLPGPHNLEGWPGYRRNDPQIPVPDSQFGDIILDPM